MDKKGKKCEVCGKESGNKKTCSGACKQKYYWNKKKEEKQYHYQYKRAVQRKLYLISLRGGKCERCPYDKNISALDFHHRNPSTKDFQLDMRTLGNKSFKSIMIEFEKCDVLCSNCHREHHHPDLSKQKMILLKERFELESSALGAKKPKCVDCGTEINYTCKRCVKCNNIERRKVKDRPAKEIIEKMRNEFSLDEIASQFNVSRRSVSRWLNS